MLAPLLTPCAGWRGNPVGARCAVHIYLVSLVSFPYLGKYLFDLTLISSLQKPKQVGGYISFVFKVSYLYVCMHIITFDARSFS